MRLTLLDTLTALIALARLGVTTRFRLRGGYWKWRNETAFGSATANFKSHSWQSHTHAVLEYGAWVARMRRLMK